MNSMRAYLVGEFRKNATDTDPELAARAFESKYLYGPLLRLCPEIGAKKLGAIQQYVMKCFDLANEVEKEWLKEISQKNPEVYLRTLEIIYVKPLLERMSKD